MDIAALSTGVSQAVLGQNVSIAVTKMALDSAQQSAAQMVQTLQSSDPALGNLIDVSV